MNLDESLRLIAYVTDATAATKLDESLRFDACVNNAG